MIVQTEGRLDDQMTETFSLSPCPVLSSLFGLEGQGYFGTCGGSAFSLNLASSKFDVRRRFPLWTEITAANRAVLVLRARSFGKCVMETIIKLLIVKAGRKK